MPTGSFDRVVRVGLPAGFGVKLPSQWDLCGIDDRLVVAGSGSSERVLVSTPTAALLRIAALRLAKAVQVRTAGL